jgi:hypothetical protein
MKYDHNYNTLVSPAEEIEVVTTPQALGIYNRYGNIDTSIDAFGRKRTSNPFTLFDSNFRYGDNYEKWNSNITGNASTVFSQNLACISMTVGHESGAEIIRETRRVMGYQPGKSILGMHSFVLNPAKDNLRQRVGQFSNVSDGTGNGIYFELDGNTAYIVKRSSVSGTIQNTRIPQSEWNINKLDGTDQNHVSLNFNKSQLFFIDYQWLGVGSIRCGFSINGQEVVCHSFHHANQESNVYISTGSLPCRLEITNTGTTTSPSTLKHICDTVISEGGYDQIGLTRSAATPIAGRELTTSNTNPVISIRLRSGRTEAVVLPDEISFYGIQDTAFKYKIVRDATTLTNASWVAAQANSSVEYDISANSISGGVTLREGVFSGKENFSISLHNIYHHNIQLNRNINATVGSPLTVVIEPTTNNDDVIVGINWVEHVT